MDPERRRENIMSLTPLADTTRASQNTTLAGLAVSNGAYLVNLLDAASTAIRRATGKDFTSTSYTEYHTVGPYIREPLQLRQYPVTRISRLAVANRCLQVLNSGNGGTIQRATIETLSNGDIRYTTVASGVVTTNTLAAATYVTVQAMANAINALGNGWSTTIFSSAAGSYNLFPVVDLKTLQGASSAMVGGCYLDIYEDWYGWNNSAGFYPEGEGSWGSATSFWRLEPETGQLFIHAPRGQMILRVDYVAGYSTIPNDLQEATVELAQHLYQSGISNSTFSAYRIGQEAVTYRQKWPSVVSSLIAPYTDHSRTFAWA